MVWEFHSCTSGTTHCVLLFVTIDLHSEDVVSSIMFLESEPDRSFDVRPGQQQTVYLITIHSAETRYLLHKHFTKRENTADLDTVRSFLNDWGNVFVRLFCVVSKEIIVLEMAPHDIIGVL